jgi:hypothetical protein
MCVFESLTDYTDYGGYEKEMRIFNNEIKGNEELMLVILNCTLLRNENDGWTVPYPYLMVCYKNVISRSLHCLIKIM